MASASIRYKAVVLLSIYCKLIFRIVGAVWSLFCNALISVLLALHLSRWIGGRGAGCFNLIVLLCDC